MSLRHALPLLLLLTACGGGDDPTTAPGPSSSPAVAAAATAPAGPGPEDVVVAVAGASTGLVLHRLSPGSRTATPFLTLEGPEGTAVDGVSLSGGTSPTVCAVWAEPTDVEAGIRRTTLLCYAPGATTGSLVTDQRPGAGVAVRPDGRALAWTEDTPNQALVVADLTGDRAVERSRELYVQSQPEDYGVPAALHDLDWLSDKTLAVTDEADSDDGQGLCLVELDQPRKPESPVHGRCLRPGPAEVQEGFELFAEAVPVAAGEVVTIERPRWCCDDAPDSGARAVRLRLADGEVLSLVAFPREGRDVLDVSGGPRALVYVTGEALSERDLSFSVRWPGEERGAPITGLPADATLAVAQP